MKSSIISAKSYLLACGVILTLSIFGLTSKRVELSKSRGSVFSHAALFSFKTLSTNAEFWASFNFLAFLAWRVEIKSSGWQFRKCHHKPEVVPLEVLSFLPQMLQIPYNWSTSSTCLLNIFQMGWDDSKPHRSPFILLSIVVGLASVPHSFWICWFKCCFEMNTRSHWEHS